MKQRAWVLSSGWTALLVRVLGLAVLTVLLGCGPEAVRHETEAPPEEQAPAPAAPSRKAPPAPARRFLRIADNGESKYRIVIADGADAATMHAAAELQAFFQEITGAELPIISDRLPAQKREILLGNSARLKQLGVSIDFDALGKEGYVIRTSETRLIIAGGEPRGTLYGVYGLLSDHLGCRWFTPEVSRIPKHARLDIPELDETRIPTLEYRETYLWESYDGDWAARNRLNRNSRDGGLAEHHGGRWEFVPGYFAHTFSKFVPPDRYFRSHPEYFSLVNGRRKRDQSQLCCTNEEVIGLVTEGVLKIFREHPEADIVSVSQNDWFNSCECPKCTTLSDSEGTSMAPVLHMVNRVAEAVEKEFPGKSVETLAYQWTRKAPKTLRPRPNVVIRLCTIECCFSHPLRRCNSPQNIAFARDLREWSGVADRLWIWNYNTSFAHYFIPFPDLRARGDNVRFFTENHVRGIFQQDVYSTGRGELSELSGYLNARLLWDPYCDEDEVINDFLSGVYGPAARPVREYIDLLHDAAERDNIHIGIWQGPDAEYLTDSILASADSLWDAAETATAGHPDIQARVRIARLSSDYAIICRDRLRGNALTVNQESCRIEANPSFTARLDRFCRVAAGAGVRRLKEYDTTVDEFRAEVEKDLAPRTLKPVGPASCTEHEPGLVWKYYEGAWRRLPDFGKLSPNRTGTVERFALPFTGNGNVFGFTVEGYITVPRDGVYTFWTRSDGYSTLTVSGREVVRNGGMDPIRERQGFIALKAGLHPVSLVYFTREACTALTVSWRGPGFDKTEIPADSFRYTRSAAM